MTPDDVAPDNKAPDLSQAELASLEVLGLTFKVLAFECGEHRHLVKDMPSVEALVACAKAVIADMGWH